MPKEQPAPQATQPVKSSVKPTEPTIPEQIADILARALQRLNRVQAQAPAV